MSIKTIVNSTLFALIVIFFGFSSPTFAQANNTITGFIFGPDRTSLSEIPVELQNENYQTLSRVKTDGSGRYFFARVSQGRFYIKVLPIGTSYQEQTGEVEIVNIVRQSGSGGVTFSATENVQRDFYLRDKRTIRTTKSIVGVVFAQEVPQEAKTHYENAVDNFNDGKKQNEVTEELLKALNIFPSYYLALERLTQQYIKLGDFKSAAYVADKAVEVNPKSFDSWYALGYALHQQKSHKEAVNALSMAISLDSASVNALFVLGVNLRLIGKYAESEESLLKAKKLAPAPIADIHWQLALLYTNNLKKYSAAVKELELFLKANPKYEEAEKVRELIKKLKVKEKV